MKIKITDMNTPSMFLMNAVCTHFANEKDDILAKLNLKPEDHNVVEVKMTVNGVEIPFADTIEDYWQQCVADRNKHALEKAKEIISGTALENLFAKIRDAEWQIDNALNEVLEKLNNEAAI